MTPNLADHVQPAPFVRGLMFAVVGSLPLWALIALGWWLA